MVGHFYAFDCNKFPELAEKYHPKVNDTSLSFFNISFDSKFNQTNGDAIVNGEELLERAMLDTVLLAGQNQTKTTTVLSKITVSSHVQAVHNLFAIFGPLLTAVTIMPIVAVFLAKYLTCWDGIRLIKGHHEQAFINGEWVTLSYSEPSYLDLTKCHLVNGIIIGTIASGGLAAGLYIAESKLGYFEDNYITQYTTNTTTTKNLTWQSYELDLQNPLVDNVAMEHYQ